MKCPSCGKDMVNTIGGCYNCPYCGMGIHDGVHRPSEILHYTGVTPTVEEIHDDVNHPSHYTEGRKYEPIDVIEDWNLGFNLGNALKYISRAGRKNDIVQDLKKARFYLDREIQRLKE